MYPKMIAEGTLADTVRNYGDRIACILEELLEESRGPCATKNMQHQSRILLSSGFLCLAAWALSGMSSIEIINKIMDLRHLLIIIDHNYPSFSSATNPTNQERPGHQQN